MKQQKSIFTIILSSIGMFVLILDSETALKGAAEGLELCLRTVIVSLFPFFVLSILLTDALSGRAIPILSPVSRLCRIPEGSESLLLVGLLGGYPVGAQCVTQAYQNGKLTIHDAHRLLGFCSNAGPAFIFGIAGSLFPSPVSAWSLWIIHILSALFVGFVLPGKPDSKMSADNHTAIGLPGAAAKAIRVMGSVCGWVILFRVITAFIDRWFLWLLPDTLQIITVGLLELVNGCHALFQSQQQIVRFILCSVFLGFGGICVGMQTVSVTGKIGTGWYFPGKLLQASFSLFLSSVIGPVLFSQEGKFAYLPVTVCGAFLVLLLIFMIRNRKKAVAFSGKPVYNGFKNRGRYGYAVPKKD